MATTYSESAGGLESLSYFYNCTSGFVTYKNSSSSCAYVDLDQRLNLAELLAMVRDPEGFINSYAGLVKLPFAGDRWFNQFILTLPTAQGIMYENLFFDEEDASLRYIYFEHDPETVYAIENGMVPQIFTDADFEEFTQCASSEQPPIQQIARIAIF